MSALAMLLQPPSIKPQGGRIVRKLNAQAPDEPRVNMGRRPIDCSADPQELFTLLERLPGLSITRIQMETGWTWHRSRKALKVLMGEGNVSMATREQQKFYYAVDA